MKANITLNYVYMLAYYKYLYIKKKKIKTTYETILTMAVRVCHAENLKICRLKTSTKLVHASIISFSPSYGNMNDTYHFLNCKLSF